jgi:hypothetical protein
VTITRAFEGHLPSPGQRSAGHARREITEEASSFLVEKSPLKKEKPQAVHCARRESNLDICLRRADEPGIFASAWPRKRLDLSAVFGALELSPEYSSELTVHFLVQVLDPIT